MMRRSPQLSGARHFWLRAGDDVWVGSAEESDGERALFLGDLIPTAHHLPLPWIMGYDVEPLVTLETKRRILARAADEGWLLVFEHDAHTPWGRVQHDGKSYALVGED